MTSDKAPSPGGAKPWKTAFELAFDLDRQFGWGPFPSGYPSVAAMKMAERVFAVFRPPAPAPSPGVGEVVAELHKVDGSFARLAPNGSIRTAIANAIALIERQSAELLRLRKSFAPPSKVEASGEVGEGG